MRYMPVIALLIVVVILLTAFFVYSNCSPHPTPIATSTPTAIPTPTIKPTPTSNSTANLTASITENEDPSSLTGGQAFLNLDGSVSNVGQGVAYNAGLHVVAYDAQGALQINATVPLAFEEMFTNPYGNWQSGINLIGGSHSVTSLSGGQAFQIRLNIYHSGTVTNWTVTPVWTNNP
jgi:hypothetical protein